MRRLLVLSLALPAALASACVHNDPNPNVPPNTSAWPPPTAPPPSAWPPPSANATPPPVPTTTQGPSATPLDPSATGAAAAAIAADAAVDAPGMGREGSPLAGSFQEGQVLEQPITIVPGRCYTFIAAGVGPQEIEIQLVAQSPIPQIAPLMGDQRSTGGKVVLGKGTGCIKLALIPLAVPAKWVIKASRGSGVIAGQAFSK
jgi:hypothetical protein